MATQSFDPFSSRLARDIRNTLSQAYVHSLEQGDPSLFRNSAAELLTGDLAPIHRYYIRDRLERYDQAFAEIRQNSFADELTQALVMWNKELFFEVHERLEVIWQEASGERRQALKGLIKAAAAYVHKEHGNKKAALSLAVKAVALLSRYGEALPVCLNLSELLERLERPDEEPLKFEISSTCVATI